MQAYRLPAGASTGQNTGAESMTRDFFKTVLNRSGGPDRTRICDLYRVKVAL